METAGYLDVETPTLLSMEGLTPNRLKFTAKGTRLKTLSRFSNDEIS